MIEKEGCGRCNVLPLSDVLIRSGVGWVCKCLIKI